MNTMKEVEAALALITGSPAFAEVMREYDRLFKIISNVEDEEMPALCLVALTNIGKPLAEKQDKYSELKRVIREAARIRGESWDQVTERVNPWSYSKSINQAVCEVTQDDDTIKLASMLLACCWNNALEFAGSE